jgi:rubredoxin
MADVKCPNCAGRYHETTGYYDPSVPPNGSMFRLKAVYRENAWTGFVEDSGTIGDNLCCPDCGGPYIVNGRVVVDLPDGECPVCGETFKRLDMHMRAKHPDYMPDKQ